MKGALDHSASLVSTGGFLAAALRRLSIPLDIPREFFSLAANDVHKIAKADSMSALLTDLGVPQDGHGKVIHLLMFAMGAIPHDQLGWPVDGVKSEHAILFTIGGTLKACSRFAQVWFGRGEAALDTLVLQMPGIPREARLLTSAAAGNVAALRELGYQMLSSTESAPQPTTMSGREHLTTKLGCGAIDALCCVLSRDLERLRTIEQGCSLCDDNDDVSPCGYVMTVSLL